MSAAAPSPYGTGQRVLEVGAIGAFALLAAWSTWRLLAATGPHCFAVVLVAAPVGWLAADLGSGLLHWACDSFGSASTPVIGQALIRPFREHPVDPQAMTRHDFVETHGASCLAALPFLAASVAVPLASWPWLWSFHAIHHSSLKMDWIAGSRIHPVDAVVTRAVAYLPVFVLGFAPPALYAYLVFLSFHTVFIHANVRWRFPYLRWAISTPEYHHWHHTSDEEGIDKNFASVLPLWDLAFGTAHQPDHWPKNYGTVKFQPPETYIGQLLYPFRRKGEATPYG